jgi:hypothetical protein
MRKTNLARLLRGRRPDGIFMAPIENIAGRTKEWKPGASGQVAGVLRMSRTK